MLVPTKPVTAVTLNCLPAGQLRVTVDSAFQAAGAVHEVRDEAQPVVVASHPGMTQLGLYAHERGGRPLGILVNAQAAEPGLTVLHEFGHYLDQHGIGLTGYASESSELSDWRNAVLTSQAVAELIGHWVTPPGSPGPTAAERAAVEGAIRSHVEYLLGPNELFARSYCQYIAIRSGDADLRQELEITLQPAYREQWEEEDFEPVAAALDKLFHGLGWR